MYCITFLITIFVFTEFTDQANSDGRSVPAIVDICSRFPTLPSCQSVFAGNETENVTVLANVTTTAEHNTTTIINVTLTTPIPQSQIDEYCARYLKHFEYFCTNATTTKDQVVRNYCYSYAANCIRFNINLNTTDTSNVTQLAASATTIASTSLQPQAQQGNVSKATYCKDQLRDYSNFCLHKLIPGFALQFCSGYQEFCPNAPKVGSGPDLVPSERKKRQTPQGDENGQLNLFPNLPNEPLPKRQKSLNLQEILYDPYFNALETSKRTLDQLGAVGANNMPANRGILQ